MKNLNDSLRVKHGLVIALATAVVLGGWYTIVQASLADGPDIIMAPSSIEQNPNGATNSGQQAFVEQLGVELPRDVQCDTNFVFEGTVVDSHMIFFNTAGGGISSDLNQVWTFDDTIVCVMSSTGGIDQAITNDLFAAQGTVYPGPFLGRGLENNDSYSVDGDSITVSMIDESPGDWIRVLTEASVPSDTLPPIVQCEAGTNPGGNESKSNNKGKNDGGFLTFVAIDNVDGEIELEITDTESGQTFGPVMSGSNVKHTVAKGSIPTLRIDNSGLDYQLRTQGSIELTATDTAGNVGTATCN